MLTIKIPKVELYDENSNRFFYGGGQTLKLEHSLVSLSKWESKWKKAFLTKGPKTNAETLDYIRCMTITQNVPQEVYGYIDNPTMQKIMDYIEDPHTASTVVKENNKFNNETVTSEVIYSWMIILNIPVEFQKWHLNRLLMLINITNIKMNPKKRKMSKEEILARNRQINEERRAKYATKG